MKLHRLSIQRQEDGKFAIVAVIHYNNGSVAIVPLETSKTPKDLQSMYVYYLGDEEALQVCVEAKLRRFAS